MRGTLPLEVSWLPTAQHVVADGHATPVSMLEPALGLGVTDQPMPFHVSTSVADALAGPERPTATHFVELGHATPESRLEKPRFALENPTA